MKPAIAEATAPIGNSCAAFFEGVRRHRTVHASGEGAVTSARDGMVTSHVAGSRHLFVELLPQNQCFPIVQTPPAVL